MTPPIDILAIASRRLADAIAVLDVVQHMEAETGATTFRSAYATVAHLQACSDMEAVRKLAADLDNAP